LRKENQQVFDRLFEEARLPVEAGDYAKPTKIKGSRTIVTP